MPAKQLLVLTMNPQSASEEKSNANPSPSITTSMTTTTCFLSETPTHLSQAMPGIVSPMQSYDQFAISTLPAKVYHDYA